MLHIKIVPPYFFKANIPKHLRNNPEWLRKLAKNGDTKYINPYSEKDWFFVYLIEPYLYDGFVKDEYWNVELECLGIKYVLEKPTKEEIKDFSLLQFGVDRSLMYKS